MTTVAQKAYQLIGTSCSRGGSYLILKWESYDGNNLVDVCILLIKKDTETK